MVGVRVIVRFGGRAIRSRSVSVGGRACFAYLPGTYVPFSGAYDTAVTGNGAESVEAQLLRQVSIMKTGDRKYEPRVVWTLSDARSREDPFCVWSLGRFAGSA
jgi:hypothetical protein